MRDHMGGTITPMGRHRERTKALTVHRIRRTARREERRLQVELAERARGGVSRANRPLVSVHDADGNPVPDWARGARVEKIGLFQFAVVVTESKGH
jgi:hypothetical protein